MRLLATNMIIFALVEVKQAIKHSEELQADVEELNWVIQFLFDTSLSFRINGNKLRVDSTEHLEIRILLTSYTLYIVSFRTVMSCELVVIL